MNQDDYPSDSDASDEDFRPDKEESNSGSEAESAEEAEASDGQEAAVTKKGTKRKLQGKAARSKKSKSAEPSKRSDDEKDEEELDEEEEKKRTDALWASFLGGSGSPTVQSKAAAPSTKSASSAANRKVVEPTKSASSKGNPVSISKSLQNEKPTVAQLFEFAGEQVVLNEEGSKADKTDSDGTTAGKPTSSSLPKPTIPGIPRRGGGSGGGLGAVLNQINKKNKLTTLEKTKLDWNSFKQKEGIAEELQTHNKGKDGFLERRDFLERTDLRQFEIEKSFRQTKRSNR